MSKVVTTPTRHNGPSPEFTSPLSTDPDPSPRTPSDYVPLYINRHKVSLNETTPPTGVDKLTLTTRDYSLRDVTASGLRAVTSTDYRTGKSSGHLLTDALGHPVTADRLFDNAGPAQLDINRHGLRVTFNPSKLVTPSAGGLLCTSDADLRAAVNLVKRDLHARGILCDLDTARLYRLDLTRDADLRQSVGSYVPVFGALGLKRARNQSTYPGGVQSTHGTLGLVMYNKGAEAGLDRDNLLRGELQFKRHDGAPLKRSGVYSIRSLNDVGFTALHQLYRDTMRANVFTSANFDDLGPTLPAGDLHAELEAFRRAYGRGYYLKWVAANGVTSALEVYTLDQITDALTASGMSRAQVHRAKVYTRDLLHAARTSRTSGQLAKLYDELLTAFAA